MSNQAQNQSSTICFLVDQACEDNESYNDFSSQIVIFVKQNQTKEVRPIIDTIKKILKNKKKGSPTKVLALRLLNECLTQAHNDEFLLYVDSKIVRRLGQFARFKKESADLERGSSIFGSGYDPKASADFLNLLLFFIQSWSQNVHALSGKQTEISKTYQALIKERVTFPPEETIFGILNKNQNKSQVSRNKINNSQDQRGSQNSRQSEQGQDIYQQQPVRGSNSRQSAAQLADFQQHLQPAGRVSEQSIPQSSRSQASISSSINLDSQSFAKTIKEDYKKLAEHHNASKLVEEVMQMGGDGGDQMDDQLLTEFRSQLYEGKEFSEGFLKKLMDSSVQIKDKEQKIDKILSIIGEISTTLEKILIIKPFTAQEQKELDKKKQKTEAYSQREEEKQPMPNQKPSQNLQQHKEEDSVKQRRQKPRDTKPQKPLEVGLKQNDQTQKQNSLDQINQNVFKTNFAINQNEFAQPDQQFKKDIWGTGMAQFANQNASHNFGFADSNVDNFSNFEPIKSSFDSFHPSNQNSFRQSPEKKLSTKSSSSLQARDPANSVSKEERIQIQSAIKPQLNQPIIQSQVNSKPNQANQNAGFDFDFPVPQRQEIQKPSLEEIKEPKQNKNVSSLNNHEQRPMQIIQKQENKEVPKQIISNKLQPKSDDLGMSMKEDPFSLTMTFKNPNSSLNQKRFEESQNAISKPNSKPEAPLSNGIQMKQQSQLAQIQESPDADLSDEEEFSHVRNSMIDSEQFKFPSPSKNNTQLKQTQAQDVGSFSFDFNQASKVQPVVQSESNIQKPQSIEDPFKFEQIGNEPVVIQKKKDKSIKVSSGFEPQKQIFQTSAPDNKINPISQQNLDIFKTNPIEEPINMKDSQVKQQFDFNFGDPYEDTDPSFQTQSIIMHSAPNDKIISQLNDQITVLSFDKDYLKHEYEAEQKKVSTLQQKLKESEDQNHSLESKVSVLTDKLRASDREKQDLQKRFEDLESQLKKFKKFQFLYEQELAAKNELEKELTKAQCILVDMKQKIEDQENQNQKKEKEFRQLQSQIQSLEDKITEVQQRGEEIFESKKREDQIRVQLQSEVSEIKRREEANIRKLIAEVEEIKIREDELQQKYILEEEKAVKRESMLKGQIQELQQQNEELKSKQKQTPQQKLVLRTSAIKFQNNEQSRNEQMQSVSSFQSQNMSQRSNNQNQSSQSKHQSQDNIASQSEEKKHSSSKSLKFNFTQYVQAQSDQKQDQQNIQVKQINLFDDLIKTQSYPVQNNDTINQNTLSINVIQKDTVELETFDKELSLREEEQLIFYEEQKQASTPDKQQLESNDEFYDALNELDVRDDLSSPSQNSPDKQEIQTQNNDQIQNNNNQLLEERQENRRNQLQQSEDNSDILKENKIIDSHNQIDDDEEQLPPVPSSDSDREDAQNDLANQTQRQDGDDRPTTPIIKHNPQFNDTNLSLQQPEQSQHNQNQQAIDFDFNSGVQSQNIQEIQMINENSASKQNLDLKGEQSNFSFAFPSSTDTQKNVVLDQKTKNQLQSHQSSEGQQIDVHESPQKEIIRPPSPIKLQEEILSSYRKQDSFMEMFGDILNPNNDQNSQKQPPVNLANKELDLDELLNFSMTSPNKNTIIEERNVSNEKVYQQKPSESPEQKQFSPAPVIQHNDKEQLQINHNSSFPPPQILSQQMQHPIIGIDTKPVLNIMPEKQETNILQSQNNQNVQTPILQQNHQQIVNQMIPSPQIDSQLQQHINSINNHPVSAFSPSVILQNTSPQNNGNFNNQMQGQKDIVLDKSQFTTANTEQIARQQQQQQNQLAINLNPQALMRSVLQNLFRKSLAQNKCVLFEDQNLKIGMLSEFRPTGLVNVRLFFANKNQNSAIQGLKLIQGPLMGMMINLNRDFVPTINFEQQEPIDISLKISSFQLSIPVLQVAYGINNSQQLNIPIRIPVIVLRFCQALPALDAQTFLYKWNFECNVAHQFKISFSVDFNQCRSLSQLKDLLQLGKQTFNFVDGVEQAKNVICGATSFSYMAGFSTSSPLVALIKITVTANGQNCEIIGRSNDNEVQMAADPNRGKFVQHVMNNILEMIALQVNP